MRRLFREHPEACDATLLVAERCEVALRAAGGPLHGALPRARRRDGGVLVPRRGRARPGRALPRRDHRPGPAAGRVRAGRDHLEGLRELLPRRRRLHQLVQAQRDPGRPGPRLRRGSLAAYAMRITELDPLEHGLIFERFLNPERESMPDFDVDFDDRRRGEVIKYVTDKYGADHVAQIVTYGTIAAKQALKDSARVLGHPFAMGDRLTKVMPDPAQGHHMHLADVLDPTAERYNEAAELRTIIGNDPEVRAVFDTAVGLEGPEAAVGRPRRRRHPLERAPARRHPDHEAGAGRPDHHAVRLSGVRGARPREDGLPRAAQPHDHRRRARQHRGEPRRPSGPRGAGVHRRGDVPAALQRGHARGVPARLRAAALAPEAHEAGQLRRHLRRHRALPSRPDGRGLAHELRAAQETASSRSRRSTPSSPSRSPTSSRRATA